MEKDTEKLNRLFDKHKDKFVGNFHGLLWKLLVDKIRKDKSSALVQNYAPEGHALGIADQGQNGYVPTMTYFKDSTSYDDADAIIDELNQEIFGLDDLAASKILLSSMRR